MMTSNKDLKRMLKSDALTTTSQQTAIDKQKDLSLLQESKHFGKYLMTSIKTASQNAESKKQGQTVAEGQRPRLTPF